MRPWREEFRGALRELSLRTRQPQPTHLWRLRPPVPRAHTRQRPKDINNATTGRSLNPSSLVIVSSHLASVNRAAGPEAGTNLGDLVHKYDPPQRTKRCPIGPRRPLLPPEPPLFPADRRTPAGFTPAASGQLGGFTVSPRLTPRPWAVHPVPCYLHPLEPLTPATGHAWHTNRGPGLSAGPSRFSASGKLAVV